MGPAPFHGDDGAHRALAPRLDARVGRLGEDGGVAPDEVGNVGDHAATLGAGCGLLSDVEAVTR